ncbi:hypothetical protein CJ030_MR1G004843 [Morella rubra]|uniref:Uncharacterized protein n=1 Tax=Morella rubra TaxID=262757 RepID=A0A6A1WMC8_9ROSI|nr:hypothetical protein CJ030_MR1G004843 [Morella rubra]
MRVLGLKSLDPKAIFFARHFPSQLRHQSSINILHSTEAQSTTFFWSTDTSPRLWVKSTFNPIKSPPEIFQPSINATTDLFLAT